MKTKIHSSVVTERLVNYAKKERKKLTFGLILTMIRTVMEIIGPMIIGYILNHYIKRNMMAEDVRAIAGWLILYLLVYVLCGVFSNFSRIFFEKAANNIAYYVQQDVYQHVQELPISYFDSLPAGNIVSRITNDTNRLKSMFQLILADMVTAFVMIVGLYLMILVRNFSAAMLLLIFVPIVYAIFTHLRVHTANYTRTVRRLTGDINADINEDIQNMEIIQALNKENYIKQEFDRTNRNIFHTGLKLTKLKSYSGYRAIDTLQLVGAVVVLFYFGMGRITGWYVVSIGSMYIVIDYVTKIFNNTNTMVSRFGELEQAYASAMHIFDLFQLKTMAPLSDRLGDMEGHVDFQDVTFAYTDENILKNLNFHVRAGESVAFVGATGSGKSTVINLLLNFYQPKSGQIMIDQKNIATINRCSLREQMAVVLQDAFLFETTIRENIRLDDDRFTDEEIKEALHAVGGDRIIERGIDSKVLEKGNNLSQGEKQLIAFARAYIRNPKILILDEATSNIDTETEKMIQRGIEKLSKNRTTFIIAHRLSTIKYVDRIFVLNKGRIIEEGNHGELLAKNGYYRSMYQEQILNS